MRAIGGGAAHPSAVPAVFDSGVILIAVPDRAIGAVAQSLAKAGGRACRGKIALHTSGALDHTVLAPLTREGAFTGSLHPMQTFSGKRAPELRGTIFGIEGDRAAIGVAARMARELGGVPVKLRAADKPAYHAAGVLAAGHALALVEAAARVLISIGFTRRRALEALLPLTREMLDNLQSVGLRAAWTGPVARGDFEIVARHRRALGAHPREFARAYDALAALGARVLSAHPARTIAALARAGSRKRKGGKS